MTPFRRFACTAAVAALLAGSGSADAAWNNVFQVCCNSCRTPAVAAYTPAVPAVPVAAPQQQCSTQYVQRSYYQPVTSYVQRTYYEPVTSYRTSYYYEPVTSYRTSYYCDPCAGPQQVVTPEVSYRLRSQVTPVTSYLQRCAMQPVTSYQLAYYYEPQTTCCQTTIGAPVAAPPVAGAVAQPLVPVAPPAGPVAAPAPPAVGEQRQQPLAVPPGVSEQRDAAPSSSESQRYPAPASAQPMPRASDGATFRPATPSAPPAVRLDRIVSIKSAPNLQGEVVNADQRPAANVQLVFVHAEKRNTEETTRADETGRFRVTLDAGTWLVYTRGADGKTDFRRKVDVRDDQPTELRLVSR